MSRFIPHTDMSADELIQQALAVAGELVGIMHDALERHEGLKGAAK